jgi:hypothetical protein
VSIRSLDVQSVLHALPAGWGRAPAGDRPAQPASASSSARAWAVAKSSAPV